MAPNETSSQDSKPDSYSGFPLTDINEQLQRILQSPLFENKNRPKRFLDYVVGETLAERAHLIKGYTLGIEVFDKDDDFDPQTDAIVRVEAGRLRRLLDHYYMEQGIQDPIRIALPKGTYVPEISKHESEAAETANDPILAAAAPPTGPAIAILPFDNMSGDETNDLFCDGIAEEIINHLSFSPGLYVISRKSSFQYKGQDVDVRKISGELEAQYALEGSLRIAGSTLRITARLLEATTATMIWTESYDRQFTPEKLIEIQDEIAGQVAATIGDTYGTIMRSASGSIHRATTEHMEAYQGLMEFHNYLYEMSPDAHLKARNALEKSLELDPNYPDAWAGMAFVTLDEYRFSFNAKPDLGDPLERAREYAEKSIALHSQFSIAWYAMTLIHFHKGELDQFENNIRLGLTLAPNSPAVLADSGVYLCLSGQLKKGLALVHKAMELNPQHPSWCDFALFHNQYIKGKYEKAIDHVEIITMPNWFWPHALQAISYARAGHERRAAKAAEQVLKLYPDFRANAEKECRKWFQREEDLETYLTGFELAGLTEN